MTARVVPVSAEERARAKVLGALRLVCASMPHLAGLVAAVQVFVDRRVPTACVSQAGRIFVNPDWFGGLDTSEAIFITAHELMHLCLQSHERGIGTDGEVFNWAHDYIINDMLVHELGRPVPKGGLDHPGARLVSAEKMVMELLSGRVPGPKPMPKSPMSRALEDAGLLPPMPPNLGPGTGDVLSPEMERRLLPHLKPSDEERLRQRLRAVAAKSNSLKLLKDRLDTTLGAPSGAAVFDQDQSQAVVDALRSGYCPPWEMALQQWMEAIAPGPRSYARPSRRGADRTDVVLPGRTRQGFALHIVLDTSGSMAGEIPRLLGVIATFCESVGVAAIHVLQCDERVTADEWLEPEDLARYTVSGYGGSDMSPALVKLAEDPEVEAAIVLTDGYIGYPEDPVPYHVLWVLTGSLPSCFTPGYGQRIVLPTVGSGDES